MQEDLAQGLVGKTAIHPSQVRLIELHYRMHQSDVEAALSIMNPDSPAVFKMHNSMCEVATHRAWAHGVVEQARIFGIDTGLHRQAKSPAMLPFLAGTL